jgi:predicted nuclease of predicted toxin-antitoxin system
VKLSHSAFLADENIHPEVVRALRAKGLDVLAVRECKLIGSGDLVLLRKARAERRIILTHDSDFGTLAIAGGEPILGIVYLRPGHITPEFTLGTLTTILNQETELTDPFLLVAVRKRNSVRIRIRQL